MNSFKEILWELLNKFLGDVMKDKETLENKREIDLLIEQRSCLVQALGKTNALFNQTLGIIISAIITIVAAESIITSKIINKDITLILIQLIILSAIYITIQLITGNLQRYYICAIDDYLFEEYDIACLFYQGNLSKTHTIGKLSNRHIFPWMTTVGGGIAALVLGWFIIEYKVYLYIIEEPFYLMLVFIEGIFLIVIMIINAKSKEQHSKEYVECKEYLRRNKINKEKKLSE